MTTEIWKTVPSVPTYEVSSLGRVWRKPNTYGCKTGRIIRTHIKKSGYVHVCLYRGAKGDCRHTFVHIIMGEAFLGPKPSPEHEIAHGDAIRSNNILSNIRYATPKENAADRKRHGIHKPPKGEQHWHSKLTASIVKEMRLRKANGYQTKDLAEQFGVSVPTASEAINGRTWAHII